MGDTNIDENISNNGTYFKEIFSLFLGTIQDYNLKNMFIYNPEVAEDMMETFLKKSIPYFYNCQKDIKNADNIDMKCKKFLNNVMQEFLAPIRARREEYEKDKEEILEFLAKPIPFCRYCKVRERKQQLWEVSKKDIKEWV